MCCGFSIFIHKEKVGITMKVEKIGLLGFGTVGSGVYHILTKNQMSIEKKQEFHCELEKALVKEPETICR